MLVPIDFSRIETALSTRSGWIELGLVAVCLAAAWLIERRVLGGHADAQDSTRRLHGSFVRVVFPLTALVLVSLASFIYERQVGPPFVLAIAQPMLIALAVIRMFVYGLRRLFPAQSWLPASERAIAFTVWGLVV